MHVLFALTLTYLFLLCPHQFGYGRCLVAGRIPVWLGQDSFFRVSLTGFYE